MKIRNIEFMTGLNTAANAVSFMIANAVGIGDADAEGKVSFQISPAGDFPNVTVKNGKQIRVVQRIDAEAMNAMIADFNSVTTKIAHLMRGLPIYEGHIDSPDQLAKNGSQAKAVGRIKKLYLRDGSLWADAVMNADGVAMISGDAAAYSANSPHWQMVETKETANGMIVMKPIAVVSTALVNSPNLPNNYIGLNMDDENFQPENNTNMELTKLIQTLGLDEGASLDDVIAAITALQNKVTSAEGDKTALDAANTALNAANTELAELKAAGVKVEIETALNSAVSEGRITEAQKPAFESLLNSNLEHGKMALEALPATNRTLNSKSQIGKVTNTAATNAAPGQVADKVDLTPAFNKVMAENGFDKNSQAHVDEAWKIVRASNS